MNSATTRGPYHVRLTTPCQTHFNKKRCLLTSVANRSSPAAVSQAEENDPAVSHPVSDQAEESDQAAVDECEPSMVLTAVAETTEDSAVELAATCVNVQALVEQSAEPDDQLSQPISLTTDESCSSEEMTTSAMRLAVAKTGRLAL